MDTSDRDRNIDGWFPAAAKDGYKLRSDPDDDYNCIAWAASVTAIPWWPTDPPLDGVYWPPAAPRETTLQAFIEAYATIGYKPCGKDGSLQRGYEKIAIYVGADGKPTHAARQLSDGLWTSKLGPYRDITTLRLVGLRTCPAVHVAPRIMAPSPFT